MNLPKGYQTVMPYLVLKDVAAFLEFAEAVFGASELSRHKDEEGSIRHAEIQIGGSTIMMGQSNENWPSENAGLFIYVENANFTFRTAIEHGATEIMPVENKDYGRTAGVKDPQGNTWWITQPIN